MAQRHDEITAAGGRVVGITIDSPLQNSALISKLDLPFPILSDPDRSGAITPFGVADEKDERIIARPATVIVDSSGSEIFRFVSRDFADRITEDSAVEALAGLGLGPTTQEAPQLGPASPGPRVLPIEHLRPYYRGARFAVIALSRRFPEIDEEAAAYIDELDRYTESVIELYRRQRASAEDS